MIVADVVFEKLFDDGAFENDKTLDYFMEFIDAFAPCEHSEQEVFTGVLVDCIKEYQRQAFALGFKCCVDAFLESRTLSEVMTNL